MPKNMFQRPQPVTRSGNVPRHGAPIPTPKLAPRQKVSRPDAPSLPPLAALLNPARP